jgi:hypothetical protein
MSSNTYIQAMQIARERFTALNSLDITDFSSFKEYMEVYNTLWEQGMEMMNFAREIEDDMYLEGDCESAVSEGDDNDDASSRNGDQ